MVHTRMLPGRTKKCKIPFSLAGLPQFYLQIMRNGIKLFGFNKREPDRAIK